MSFFLSEIRILKLDVTDHDLVVNVIKALSGTGFEDEKDSAEDSSESGEQVVDLHILVHDECGNYDDRFRNSYFLLNTRWVSSEALDIATPPPKVAA